jgi:hypothetical protein
MLNGRTIRQAGIILGFGLTVTLFQNCAKHQGGLQAAGIANPSSGVQVIATSSYSKVAFNSQGIPGASADLQIDFDAGTVNSSCHYGIASDGNPSDVNLAALKSLLSNARVCQPAALTGDQVSCMGMSVPDIDLGSGANSISLARLFCNTGTFLCDGDDEVLRGLLANLKAHPAACQ